MLKAYPLNNTSHQLSTGMYYLVDSYEGEAYEKRDRIQEFGGRLLWKTKQWIIHERSLEMIPAMKMIKVEIAAYCHTPIETGFVSTTELKQGFITKAFCSRCDSWHQQPITIKKIVE